MACFSVKKLCIQIAPACLLVSGTASAFPSAAFYPTAPGTVISHDSGEIGKILPKPIYFNGKKAFAWGWRNSLSGNYNFLDVFVKEDDGIRYLGNRDNDGSNGCTINLDNGFYIPHDISLGANYVTNGTVTQTCIGTPAFNDSGAYTATITPVGFETVTVAGTDYKTLRVDMRVQSGAFGGIDFTNKSWLAPKIGELKFYDGESGYTNTATSFSSAVPSVGNADWDGDGRSDPTVFRDSDGTWRSRLSSDGSNTVRSWGVTGDRAVQGDYDGDGAQDLAVFRPSNGTWYILTSATNYTRGFDLQWGASGDQTVQRDYDGDGVTDIAIFRASTGKWYIRTSNSGFTESFEKQWGVTGDQGVPRDFDGDGKADLAVFRPSTGTWYVLESSSDYTTSKTYQWGQNGDWAMAQDYDGDGKADLALFRPSNATWYIKFSSSGYTTSLIKQWGSGAGGAYQPGINDTAETGDWDGDRITDIAIFRPSEGKHYVLKSSSNFQSDMIIDTSGTQITGDLPTGRR